MRPELTVRETLELYAGYYRDAGATSRRRSTTSASARKADARARGLSGGQLRRLDVGVALIGDPDLLFLDEPTTGFDPTARRQAWEVIAGLRDLGKTVFLTTHYMEEAQRLADRVAIIAAGRIVAQGRPDELGGRERAAGRDPLPPPGGGGRRRAARRARRRGRDGDGELLISHRRTPSSPSTALTGWALERSIELDGLAGRAGRASRTSTSSSPAPTPPRRARTGPHERRPPWPCTSSATTRRPSGATRPRSSSPSRSR